MHLLLIVLFYRYSRFLLSHSLVVQSSALELDTVYASSVMLRRGQNDLQNSSQGFCQYTSFILEANVPKLR